MFNDIRTTRDGEQVVITVVGEIDLSTVGSLRSIIGNAFYGVHMPTTVCLDLSAVRFLDSAGLGVLFGALRKAKEHHVDLRIRLDRVIYERVILPLGIETVLPMEIVETADPATTRFP